MGSKENVQILTKQQVINLGINLNYLTIYAANPEMTDQEKSSVFTGEMEKKPRGRNIK